MKFAIATLLSLVFIFSSINVKACSPCAALSNVTQNLVGTNLELTFTSNAGWDCCYTVDIEIVCDNENFTGVFTHQSAQLCHSGGNNVNIPYPLTVIDLSGFCAGTYKWRAKESSCTAFTPVFTFVLTTGGTPISLAASPDQDSICIGDNIQLNAIGSGGCNAGVIDFSWAAPGFNSNISNPIVSPVVTTTYTVTATESGSCTLPQTADVTIVVLQPSTLTVIGIDDICSTGIGEATAVPDPGGTPTFTFSWLSLGGIATQTVTGLLAGSYTVEMTDGNGCVSTADAIIGDSPAAFQGSTTLVSCALGSDGTAFAEMVPVLGNVSYLWDDINAQTTQTATGLSAGSYNCTITSDIGCVGVVNVIVSELPGMIGNIVSQSDITCNSGNDGFIQINVIQGTGPYTYSWDNSISILNSASDLLAGANTVTVMDSNGCLIDVVGILNEPPPLEITFLTPITQICPEDDIQLQVLGQGGSSPYTYYWYENVDVFIDTGIVITVDPDVTNTQYCVVMTEECSSPTDTECTSIVFPTPIVPSAFPDQGEKCVPNSFEFFDASINGVEIASTLWQFDDNPTHLAFELNGDSTSFYYDEVGTYDVTMTVTSIFGCVYVNTISNIISVLPKPIADFNFSANPTTIFDTDIHLIDKSSSDVVDWFYSSTGSIPSSSNDQNPDFTFPLGVEGNYPIELVVTTELGCQDTVVRIMQVIYGITFYAPTAFTPDGDEHNQTWQPQILGVDVDDFRLLIFNRWGELIWESKDPSSAWDGTYNGKIVEDGTYQWTSSVKNPLNDEIINFSGSFVVIR